MTKAKSNPEQATTETETADNVTLKDLSIVKSVTSSYRDAARSAKGIRTAGKEFRVAYFDTVRKTLGGVVDFERAVFNCVRANIDLTVEHGRNIAQAARLADVAGLQGEHVNRRLEMLNAQAKDLVDLADSKTRDAAQPVLNYLDSVAKGTEPSKQSQAA